MGESANRPDLFVVEAAKPSRGAGKRGVRAARSRALEVVKSVELEPHLNAPCFLQQEIAWLRGLVQAMRECDVTNDLEFSLFVRRAATPEATGLEQRDVAARLYLTTMTLQRWARCQHLPYPIPRRGYLDGLGQLIERRVASLELHGAHALLATPRRGPRPKAAPPGKA